MSASDLTIRELAPEDAAAFRALRLEGLALYPSAFGMTAAEEQARPLAEAAPRLRSRTAPERKFVLGGFVNGRLVATAGFFQQSYTKYRHKGTIWGVLVHPDYQQRGIAGRLFDALLAEVARLDEIVLVQLSVATDNVPAIALYLSRGFEVYGTEPAALHLGDTAVDQYHMVRFMKKDRKDDAA